MPQGNNFECYFVEDGELYYSTDCSHIRLVNTVDLGSINTNACPLPVELHILHTIYPIEPINDQAYRREIIDDVLTNSTLCLKSIGDLISKFAWQHAIKVIKAFDERRITGPLKIYLVNLGMQTNQYRLDTASFRTEDREGIDFGLGELWEVFDDIAEYVEDEKLMAKSLATTLSDYKRHELDLETEYTGSVYHFMIDKETVFHRALASLVGQRFYEQKWTHMWNSLVEKKAQTPPPTTPSNHGDIPTDDWDFREESPLKALGYTVGASGWSKTKRHRFLQRFLHIQLPPNAPSEWHSNWGNPSTQKRKRKMINHLEGMASLFERQKDSSKFNLAIKQWRTDADFVRSLPLG